MGLQRKGSTVARHYCHCYIILVNQSQLFQLSKLRLCLDCIVPTKELFYQEIFPFPWVNLQDADLLTFTRCSMQLSLYVGYGWIYVKCQLQPLWMQYFPNDNDGSSQFPPWYMFWDCFWPHRRTIQGWRSFSADPRMSFQFFWPGEECQPAIVVDPAVQARSWLSMFSSLSSFQVLAPIINVFKLDSGQLKWVFVLQAWSTWTS